MERRRLTANGDLLGFVRWVPGLHLSSGPVLVYSGSLMEVSSLFRTNHILCCTSVNRSSETSCCACSFAFQILTTTRGYSYDSAIRSCTGWTSKRMDPLT